jgi:hypothetical protein
MKKLLCYCCGLLLTAATASGATITLWNFNSPTPDANVGTGTTAPAVGSGTASLLATNTATFATGNTVSDPAGANDNSGWNTTSYQAQGVGNKEGGVQFDVSTLGYENISVSWSERHSNTANRYTRFQYSLDGSTFIDGPVNITPAENAFFDWVVDLSSISGVNDNPNFEIRLVSEFESTATGAGTAGYVATRVTTPTTYTANGTVRFDMVTFSGTVIPEPNTMALIGLGLAGLLVCGRRKL